MGGARQGREKTEVTCSELQEVFIPELTLWDSGEQGWVAGGWRREPGSAEGLKRWVGVREAWKETSIFVELNCTGWKDRSGPPWPRKGGDGGTTPHTVVQAVHMAWGAQADGGWGLIPTLLIPLLRQGLYL